MWRCPSSRRGEPVDASCTAKPVSAPAPRRPLPPPAESWIPTHADLVREEREQDQQQSTDCEEIPCLCHRTPPWLDRLANLVGPDTTGANANALDAAIISHPHALEVGEESATPLVVSVTDSVARAGRFAADVAYFCHGIILTRSTRLDSIREGKRKYRGPDNSGQAGSILY